MNARKLLSSRRTIALAIVFCTDLIFFGAFNPRTGNSFFIVIIGCLLLAINMYVLVAGLINLLSLAIQIKVATRKRLKIFITLLVVFLILMQSIGQLSIRDVIAALLLVLLAYAYISYNAASAKN